MDTRFLSDAQIQERIREHTSARYTRLDRLERYVKTTQYEGRPDWFCDDVELFKRAPNVRSKIVGCAIDSHVGFVFKKCPQITTAPDEDESILDPTYGLDEETSTKVDAGLSQIVKHAGLLAVWKRMLRVAMSTGSAVAIPAVRNGRLVVDVIDAKSCTPTWSTTETGKVDSIEIRYPFVQDIQDPVTRRWGKTVMLFRRVIDAASDTTYVPVEAPKSKTDDVPWQVDATKTVKHDLGFCPVVWYRYMGSCAAVHEHDGEAIHAQLLDEITALDFASSQRNRAVLFNADPLVIETGVQPGYVPTETVFPSAFMPGAGPNGETDDPMNARYRAGNSQPQMRRKRAPGQAWQYQAPDAKVDLLTLPGDAVEGCQVNIAAIERTIHESLHWMGLDAEKMLSRAPMSGKALELLFQQQIVYCDDVRGDIGENAMLPIVDTLLRLCVAMSKRKVRLALPGFEVMAKLLAAFEQQETAQWVTPRMAVKWPAYFEPTETDQKAVAETTLALLEKGVLKRVTAVERVAPFYDIENPAQYAEDIEAEKKKAAEEQMAMMQQAQPAPTVAPPRQPPKAGEPVLPREPRQPKPTPFQRPAKGAPPVVN